MKKSLLKRASAAVVMAVCVSGVQAQNDFPDRSVRMVVGFAPGGSTDKLARLVAEAMATELRQSVTIENKPGAAGNLAAELVANAPADGYTVFMTTLSSQAINPHLYTSLRFDPAKSFAPIMLVAKYPLLLMTPPQLKLNSVPDFVTYSQANPGKLNFSSAGNGSPAHLAGEMFKMQAGIEATHVPYKGGGPAMMAVMSNEVQFAFETIPSGIGYVKGGKLKGLAVTSSERSGAAPDLPTMREVGVKDLAITSWAGLVAPAGTPSAVLNRLSAAAQAALNRPAVRAALAADGAQPGGGSANDFASFMADEYQAWGKVVRTAKATVN